MLYYLHHWAHAFGALRLFRYITFRGMMALLTALLWGLVVGPKIHQRLRQRNVYNIERDAVRTHKTTIPTMGGISILTGVLLASFLWMKPNVYSYSALILGCILGCVGIVDDCLKLNYRNGRGLSSFWKWSAHGLVTLGVLYVLLKNPESGPNVDGFYVPFCKTPLWTTLPAALLFLFWFFVIAGTSDAFNLTDGLDGLAIGCSLTILLTYTIFAYITGNIHLSRYLNLPYLRGVEELSILCLAIVGSGIAFLWFNAYPAEIFMGDSGSLAIGGWIGCVALMTQQAITLILVGFVLVLEALSVILQVTSFKLFHRRCFKMAPLHHHFERCEIPESKIVIRLWIVSLLCALMGLMTLKLR